MNGQAQKKKNSHTSLPSPHPMNAWLRYAKGLFLFIGFFICIVTLQCTTMLLTRLKQDDIRPLGIIAFSIIVVLTAWVRWYRLVTG